MNYKTIFLNQLKLTNKLSCISLFSPNYFATLSDEKGSSGGGATQWARPPKNVKKPQI